MRFKILLSVAAIVAATGQLHAQYAADALRFSQTTYGSTARFKALAGTQIGVGGDLSSLGANPAGLGLFTRSEFSVTPEFNSFSSESAYLGQNNVSSKDRLNLAHAGVVWNRTAYKAAGSDLTSGLLSYSFGIGYNRTNAFGNSIFFSGANLDNSIADYFSELANEYSSPSELPVGSLPNMAYEDYLIDDNFDPATALNNDQQRSEVRRGSQSELNLAFGTNFSNTFYVGGSFNIASLNYRSDAEYNEEGLNFVEDNDYNLSFQQNQVTTGNGVNVKLGVLFRPSDLVRLGINYESPTFYSITDSYSEVLNTDYAAAMPNPPVGNEEQIYDFAYRLRTPAKISGGASFFIGANGFIAADVDFVNYSKITFKSSDSRNSELISRNNRDVMNNYKEAVNYRIGAEYKLSQLMLRAGYGVQGSPYQSQDIPVTTISGGAGYRAGRVYIDLTYQNVSYDSEMRPYTLANGTEPVAGLKNSRNNVFLTLGTRF